MLDYNIDTALKPEVTTFFDEQTNTFSHVAKDPTSQSCVIFDSVLDIDYAAGRLSTESASKVLQFVESNKLQTEWIIETHVHADHLSAAPWLQERLGGKMGIGSKIAEVQEVFGKIFNEGTAFQRDGSQFDHLFDDGDVYNVGNLTGVALHTPGHTPACMTHILGDAGFTGDTLFMPDSGTGRVDFPGGNALDLFHSVQKLLALPEHIRLFVCHDYGAEGRPEVAFETTIGEERKRNIHIKPDTDAEAFVTLRNKADEGLSMPRLIIPSLQVNMRAGTVPTDADGDLVLKVPVNKL